MSTRRAPVCLNTRSIFIFITTILLSACWLAASRVQSAPVESVNAPAPPPTPLVNIDVPDEVLIGEDFEFQVTFPSPPAMGYAPYIEVYLPAKGPDGNAPDIFNTPQKCDGITFLSASTSFANPPTVTLLPTYDSLLSSSSGNLNCPLGYALPFTGMTPGSPLSGDYQLVVIELPFGSFYPSQPNVVVNVKAHLSDFADEGTPLTIYARSGFRYGNNPLDDHPADPLQESTLVSDQTTPKVFKLNKAYLGPEDEAVSGPNFITYYPLKYQLTADIADKQKISDLVITDNVPGNLQFAGNVQVSIQGNPANPVGTCSTSPGPYDVEISAPPTSGSPNGTLAVKLCSPIQGTLGPDVSITFDFFIPEFDSNATEIFKKDCSNSPVPVENDIEGKAQWDPLDPRDPTPSIPIGATTPVTSNLTKIDHVLQAKCIAIQKKVAQRLPDTGGPGLTPGDSLRYELNFQISDYRTMGKITITDLLSDGQLLVGSPTLAISDQFGSYSNLSFTAGNFSATPDPNIECPAPGGIKGGTTLTLRVSSLLATTASGSGGHPRHQNGILTGGYAAGTSSPVPAIGQIVFYARIQDKFKYQYPNTIKEYVDKDDPLSNCVLIDGLVFRNENAQTVPTVTLGNTTDGSGTQVRIAKEKPKKTLYSVKRGNSVICSPSTTPCLNLPGTPQDVLPGDNVTFRIEYRIPSGDAENLTIDDWLPSPVFDVGDPNADMVSGPSWTSVVATCTTPPPSGKACRLPGHTLIPPTLTSGTSNNLLFTYGTFFNTLNTPKDIDLLFTVTVTNTPFADGLYLTNEARENENNTFGPVAPQVTIAQVNLREPHLRILKGIIATDNPNGEFTLPGSSLPPTALPSPKPPNATLSLAGISQTGAPPMLSSNDLAAGALNNNLSNVDANDIVTFAVTVENIGGAPAYDVKVEDVIPHDTNGNPTCFTIVPNSFQVKRGTGATVNPFLYNLVFPTATGGFTITSKPGFPIPINQFDPTSGKNIVVVTFQAKLLAKIMPGCCDNEAEIKYYASTLYGPNFVAAGFGGPFKDSAQVCVKPKADKCVVATSEVHTQADNSVSGAPQPPRVAIGEIVRYHLTVTLPEGVSPFFRVTDYLPPGLTYMPGTAKVAFVSTLGISSSVAGLSGAGMPDPVNYTLGCLKPTPTLIIPPGQVTGGTFTSGVDPTFSLGILTNNDSDNNLEYVIIEFNALVNNTPTNVDTTLLRNNYDVFVGKVPIGQTPVPVATSNNADVIVVEPAFTMTKTVAPNPAYQGQTLTYTVQFINNGTADAFDVVLKDTLPTGLTLGTVTAGCPVTTTANSITMTCAQVPKAPAIGSTVIVSYQAVANPTTCPVTLQNSANLTWTSLPGLQGTTVNSTGSSTPGSSGAFDDGERNGVTPSLTLNDYALNASAPVKVDCPCCLLVSNETLSCNANGSFNYTFTLTNLSGATVSGANFSAPTGVTITPSTVSFPPLASGGSTTVTVTIGGQGAVSGATICFWVGLFGPAAPGCKIQHCVTLPSCQSACAKQPPKMVSWWPLNEQGGATVVTDIKGGHNGTPSSGSLPAWTAQPGKVGGAIFVGDNVIVPDDPSLKFGTGNFSVDAWFGSGQPALIGGIVDKLDIAAKKGYALYVQNNHLKLVMGNGTALVTYTSAAPVGIVSGSSSWHHVAVTVNRVNSVATFYIDGVGGSSFPILSSSIDISSASTLLLGGSRQTFTGSPPPCVCEYLLDEIEIFNDVVSASDIQKIFNAGPAGKCPPALGSLTVSKSISSAPPATPPATTVFPVTVTCQPSGYNQTVNLTASLTSHTFNNIPVGDSCTVSEGPLPAPFPSAICASFQWATPVYSPVQPVIIQQAGSYVKVGNHFFCNLQPTCAALPANMISWWPLNETSGTIVNDIIGSNTGAAMSPAGVVTPISAGGPISLSSQFVYNSLNFITQYVDVSPATNLNFGTGEFSIDAWVRANQSGTGNPNDQIQPIADKIAQVPGTVLLRGYSLFLFHPANSTTSKLGFVVDDGASPPASVTPIFHNAQLTSAWYHVAVTVARPTTTTAVVTLYVNGFASAPVTITVGNTTNNSSLWIGKNRLHTLLQSGFREGPVDELEIFSRAITAAEIQQIFNAGVLGKCKSTIRGIKFNDLNGNGVRDGAEPVLPNWTIKLTNSSSITQTAVTDAAGMYSFTVPAPGTYTVAEIPQLNWLQTTPATSTTTINVSPNQLYQLNFGNKATTPNVRLRDLNSRTSVSRLGKRF